MQENHFVIDGDTTLQQQEDTLNTAQSLLHFEVKSYAKGEQSAPGSNVATTGPEHPNFATLKEIADNVPVREIFLVIPDDDDVAAEDIRQAGHIPSRTRVFFNDVFVNGIIRTVAGYH